LTSFSDTSIAFANRSNSELRIAEWIFQSFNSPLLVKVGSETLLTVLKLGLPVKGLVKSTVFRQFCSGEDIEESLPIVDMLGKSRVGSILDYSVEGEKSEIGFEKAANEIRNTIQEAGRNSNIPFSVFKMSGVADVDLLEKVQWGEKLNEKQSLSFENIKRRVHEICKTASDNDVRIFIDAEESWIQNVIDEISMEMALEFNSGKAIVFNTYQMYLKDSLERLKRDFERGMEKGILMGSKLVRGAYMEKERERAQKNGYEDPINPDKQSTDDLFNKGMIFCMDNKQSMSLCAGTHNEESCKILVEEMKKHEMKANDERVYFAQLYGMSDHISFNLAHLGYNVAKYLPYGPIEYVMPYLIRRAEENRSVAGQSSRELELIRAERRRRKKKSIL
jgi:proline dehydrogenase